MRYFFLGCLLYASLLGYAQTDTTATITKDSGRLKYELKTLYTTQKAGRIIDLSAPAYSLLSVDVLANSLLINVIADATLDALQTQLQQAGIEIVSAYGRIITCRVTPAQLAVVNTLPGCRWAQPVYKPRHRAQAPPVGGNVVGQGYAALRADSLRRRTGLTGAGVNVGVLSDSYNAWGKAAAGVAADELPGTGNPNNFTTPVSVLRDYTAQDGADEGRAMLEIVHDIAPGAALFFYTAYESPTGFATGIQALANAGCKVIIDDIGYYDQPYFQDGIIAQAVDKVKADNGVTYFSAAGNSGTISYENAYQPSAYAPFTGAGNAQITAHNFAANGQPAEYYLPITVAPGAEVVLSFQWAEPFASATPAGTSTAGASTDMDIYLLRSKPTGPIAAGSPTIVDRSTDDNIGADALEILNYNNPNNTTTTTFYILITRYSASGTPPRLKVIGITDFGFPDSAQSLPGINAGTAYGHPNAAGAIAVGAVSYDDTPAFGRTPPALEYYSSKGGIPVYFNPNGVQYATPVIRQKPEVSAPDNANTSFFGYDYEGDGSPNFAGTSAAAPHAGAVAALLLQARPTLTPDQVKTALQTSAIDMDDPSTAGFDTGFDFGTGYGFMQADRAYQAVGVSGTCATLTSGSWNNPATWSCGVVPGLADEVVIGAGHIITIDGFTAKAAKVRYSGSGKVILQNNGHLSFAP